MQKDEIKEINIKMPGQILDYVDTKEHLLELFNYITNLQEELEDYKQISIRHYNRPYASKYLKQKRKELNNKNLIALDSEMIYKDYYDLKQEKERLIEINKEQANHLISKDNLSYEDYKSRNEKAIEYINKHLYMESTCGIQHPTFDGKPSYDFDCFELENILNGGDE